MKVPGTKPLADYYFANRLDLDNFVSLNEVKVFTIKMGFMKDGAHKQLPINL